MHFTWYVIQKGSPLILRDMVKIKSNRQHTKKMCTPSWWDWVVFSQHSSCKTEQGMLRTAILCLLSASVVLILFVVRDERYASLKTAPEHLPLVPSYGQDMQLVISSNLAPYFVFLWRTFLSLWLLVEFFIGPAGSSSSITSSGLLRFS